jgi:hypothetical protein
MLCLGAVTGGAAMLRAAEAQAPALPQPEATVRQIKIVTDKAPDCSSLKSIVESVTRGCKTNDERAIAVYNFMLLAHYHHAYPNEKGGLGALREINVYGWCLCGGLHTVEAALWRELGWGWRYVGWSNPGHTTIEAEYDGRWHYLDVFLKYYTWMPDAKAPGGRTIAGESDIKANPAAFLKDGLVFDSARKVYYHAGNRFEVKDGKANWRAPALLVCGDTPDGIQTGVASSHGAGSPTGWGGIRFDSPGYSTDVDLAPGYSLTLTWDAIEGAFWFNGQAKPPGHSCGDKDSRNCPAIGPVLEPYIPGGGGKRSFANGRLVFAPDFASGAVLKSLAAGENVKFDAGRLAPADAAKPASVTVTLQSPYVITRASAQAEGAGGWEVSTDGGKTWQKIDPADFTKAVAGQYACLVRVTFTAALAALRVETIVQCNRGALPYLSPGKNKVTVTAADAAALGGNRLAVTYAYCLGSRSKSYEKLCEEGAEIARAHSATWSKTPTVVQKVFAAKDLPATFQVDVPTPKDKFVVYPRMLFVRREVLAPGAKPLALPEGALEAKVAPGEELKDVPSPFEVGFAKP